jgi:hypothetical protein
MKNARFELGFMSLVIGSTSSIEKIGKLSAFIHRKHLSLESVFVDLKYSFRG